MQSFDAKAIQKRAGGQHELLSRLKREDIYRQRVLGSEAGRFIPVDDKRRLSLTSLIIYLLFMWLTTNYVWNRVEVIKVFTVNTAIKKSLETFSYDTDPVTKTWDDIQSMIDVQSWLLNALPLFVTPKVQEYNYPIDKIRFTLRRIKDMENPNKRFKTFAPRIWSDKDGVSAIAESKKFDNENSFGAYNFRNKSFQLEWRRKDKMRCSPGAKGELLDETEHNVSLATHEIVGTCQVWCEHLMTTSLAKPCRCFSYQGIKCKYFFVDKDDLKGSADDLIPPMLVGIDSVNSSANYPNMRQWIFQPKGFQGKPGFVMQMSLPSQEVLIKNAEQTNRGQAPVLQSELAYDTIRDWISGGLLGRNTTAVAIDFVTYNPNFEVFTWVQIQFQRLASGLVTKKLDLTSLVISQSDRTENSEFWTEIKPGDVIYILMVIAYVMWEFVELGQRGVKYFQFGWNLLTVLTLTLHLGTLASRYVYMRNSSFTDTMKLLNEKVPEDSLDLTGDFSTQADTFKNFLFFASLNVVFVWFQLVHYLSDCIPKIEVLVNSVYRALTPVCFLVVIVADVFCGFVIWSNLMFGKSVFDFQDVQQSLFTCIELLFGQVTAFFTLSEFYPVAGALFFFLYIFIFVIVLQNLSKAVVLTSYDDAFDAWKDRKEQKKKEAPVRLEKSNHPFAAGIKTVKGRIRQFLQAQAKNFDKEEVMKKHATKKPRKTKMQNYMYLCVFTVFCLVYIVMTYLQCQISWAFLLTQSVTTALSSFVFERTNPLSEQVSNNLRLADVLTQEDAKLYLTQVLPRALFNSSHGIFGDQDAAQNPLKLYHSALPQRFDQMVINNWNIVVGRTQPVRLSLRYANLTQAGQGGNFGKDNALITEKTSKWSIASFISDSARTFSPALVEAKQPELIHSSNAREFLATYCGNKYTQAYAATEDAQENGWACMVDREYETAKKLFEDIELLDVVNNQLATLVVDFVIYNAYAEAFTYVALWFAFQPSGEVQQGVLTYTIRLDMYSGAQFARLGLELIIIFTSCFNLGQSFRNMYRDVKLFTDDEQSGTDTTEGRKDQKVARLLHKLLQIFQALTMHFVLDPFNLLDLISSIFTVVTMVLWYTVVFDELRHFNFPERPLWEPQYIGAGDWTSDAAVIFEFYKAGRRMRWFIRICAINTIMIVLRLLKYLAIFESVKQLFRTLGTGFVDVLYFILMMGVLLMGYVISGQLLFGDISYDFSTIPNSLLACFEMFLGTFDYRSLREADKVNYVMYSVSYVIIFRYMLINMFFAIVDKAFVKEEELADKRRQAYAKREKEEMEKKKREDAELDQPPPKQGLVYQIVGMLQGFLKKSHTTEETPNSPMGETRELHGSEAAGSSNGQDMHAHGPSVEEDYNASDDEADGDELRKRLDLLMNDNDSRTNWKSLPGEVQQWAINTACPIIDQVNLMVLEKRNKEKNQLAPFDVEGSMTQAQEKLQEKLDLKKDEAKQTKKELEEERLGKLKQIHQDQEALAWYIMKRETDLRRLEGKKKNKQDRYEEVKQAAKSLINSGEDETKALDDNK